MTHLHINLFGKPQVTVDGEPLKVEHKADCIKILALLACKGRTLSRDELIDYLWQGEEEAPENPRQTDDSNHNYTRMIDNRLAELRKKGGLEKWLHGDKGTVTLDLKDVFVDVKRFLNKELLLESDKINRIDMLKEALELYQPYIMQGIKTSEAFGNWVRDMEAEIQLRLPVICKKLVNIYINQRDFENAYKLIDQWETHALEIDEPKQWLSIVQQKEAERQLAKLHNVQELPAGFVERSIEMVELRELILKKDRPNIFGMSSRDRIGGKRRTALHGIGGIGKTLMARALCWDKKIRSTFDHIIWLDVGEKPEIFSLQQKLANDINNSKDSSKDSPITKEGAKRVLASMLLGNLDYLIILDDVWQIDVLEAFPMENSPARWLITSRNKDIFQYFSANDYHDYTLNVMDMETALLLLAQEAQCKLSALPSSAHEIAEEVGCLPLALDLIGRVLRNQPADDKYWHYVLNSIRQGFSAPGLSHYAERLSKVLQLSVDQLPNDDTRQCFFDLAVFPDDAEITEHAMFTMWTVAENRKLEIKTLLESQHLIQRKGDNYIVLDTVNDFLRYKHNDNLLPLHQRLLKQYNPDGKSWPQNPTNDKYLYLHLDHHLREAGRVDELYQLLTGSPDWMDAKFNILDGNAAYIDELTRASQDLPQPLNATSIVKLTQLWAAQQIVYARTNAYTDEMLKTLVVLGHYESAKSYALLRPEAHRRFEGLWSIYELMDNPDENLLDTAQQAAIESTNGCHDYYLRQISLAWLKLNKLDKALTVTTVIKENSHRYQTLQELVLCLVDLDQPEVIIDQVIMEIDDLSYRAKALCAEAMKIERLRLTNNPRVSNIFKNAWKTAHRIIDQYSYRSEKLDVLAIVAEAEAKVTDNGTEKHLNEITKMISQIKEDSYFGSEITTYGCGDRRGTYRIIPSKNTEGVLCKLAKVYTEIKAFEKSLEIISMISSTSIRALALLLIAPVFTRANHSDAQKLFAQIEQLASEMNDENRIMLLRDLVETLAEVGWFDEALRVALQIDQSDFHGVALIAIAKAQAKANQLEKALITSELIDAIDRRTEALVAITEELAKACDDQVTNTAALALEMALLIDVDNYREEVLEPFPHIISILVEAWRIDLAQTISDLIQNDDLRSKSLLVIVEGFINTNDFKEAETVARHVPINLYRAKALANIATALAYKNPRHAEIILQEARTAALEQSSPTEVSESVSAVVNALEPIEAYNEAEQLVNLISDLPKRAIALSDLAEIFAEHGERYRAVALFEQVEATVDNISDIFTRVLILRVLGAALARIDETEWSRTMLEHSWKTVMLIDPSERPYKLADVASACARTNFIDLAETITKQIKLPFPRAWALRYHAQALARVDRNDEADLLFEQAKEETNHVEDSLGRVRALCYLANSLHEASRTALANKIWEEARTEIYKISSNREDFENNTWYRNPMESRTLRIRIYALGELAKSLLDAGKLVEAERIWQEARTLNSQSYNDTSELWIDIVAELIEKLTELGHYDKAEALYVDEKLYLNTNTIRHMMAAVHAQKGEFEKALSMFNLSDVNEFMKFIAEWGQALEKNYPLHSPNLHVQILRSVASVLAWEYPLWREVNKLLETVPLK